MTLVYLYSELVVHIFTDFPAYPLHCIVNRFVAFAQRLCNLGIFLARKVFFEYLALHTAEKAAVLVRKQCRQCILHKTASGLLVISPPSDSSSIPPSFSSTGIFSDTELQGIYCYSFSISSADSPEVSAIIPISTPLDFKALAISISRSALPEASPSVLPCSRPSSLA